MRFPQSDNVQTRFHYCCSVRNIPYALSLGSGAVGPPGQPGPPGPPGPPGVPGHSSGSHSTADYRRYIMEYMQSEYLLSG